MIKSVYRYLFPSYINELEKLFSSLQIETLLDVGCGHDSPIRYVNSLRKVYKFGLDGFQPSIQISKENKIHEEYYCADLIDFSISTKKKFDAIILSDVVEHFELDDAIRLISNYESLANKIIIVFTPNGFIDQGPLYSNPWQIHKCGFKNNFFIEKGFKTIGVGGLKQLRKEVYLPIIKPRIVGDFVCDLTTPLVRKIPSLAYSILAYKIK